MAPPRKLLVLGPLAQVLIVVVVLVAAIIFYVMGDRVQPAILVTAIATKLTDLLPIARGRPNDIAKVVVRRAPTVLPKEHE